MKASKLKQAHPLLPWTITLMRYKCRKATKQRLLESVLEIKIMRTSSREASAKNSLAISYTVPAKTKIRYSVPSQSRSKRSVLRREVLR